MLSVVSDFTSKSTHYMARPDNLLNLYFVKFSWGWTLLFPSAFVFVTSRRVQTLDHATFPKDISVSDINGNIFLNLTFI